MKKKSILVIVLIMGVLSFCCLTISFSYSYIEKQRITNNSISSNIGNYNVVPSVSNISSSLSLMSDNEGLAQADYSLINISSNSGYNVYYNTIIGYNTSFSSGWTANDLIPLEYVRYAIFDVNNNVVADTPLAGPAYLNDLPVNSASTSNVYNSDYFMMFGIIEPGIKEKKFAFKFWADENTPIDYQSSMLKLSASVNTETLVTRNLFEVSGTAYYYDWYDCYVLPGATVSLNHGIVKTTTDENGHFTLPIITEGTYLLSIENSFINAEMTFNITIGNANTIAYTPTGSAKASNIPSFAYTNYMTPYLTLRWNSVSGTSNSISQNLDRLEAIKITSKDTIATTKINLGNIYGLTDDYGIDSEFLYFDDKDAGFIS